MSKTKQHHRVRNADHESDDYIRESSRREHCDGPTQQIT